MPHCPGSVCRGQDLITDLVAASELKASPVNWKKSLRNLSNSVRTKINKDPVINKDPMMKTLKIIMGILLCLLPSFYAQAGAKELNVLLITVDTLRYDRVSYFETKHVKTPHIDELASRSAVFHRAFAHTPLTLPSHTNILTGTTPLYHGISDNPGFKLEERFLTLAEYLKDFKYSTSAFIGSFPLDSRFGLDQGFDVYDDNYGVQRLYSLYFAERRAEEVIRPAIQWIEKQQDKWFSWIHLFDPHTPYAPPAPFDSIYADDPYSGEAAYTDMQLGVLFDYLKRKGLMENTLIVLTADHGEAFGEKGELFHSYFAYNSTMHIPLIVYVPGMRPASVQENAAHVDIYPTVCDVLGFKVPKPIQGESLIPLIQGKSRKTPEIYIESLSHYLTMGLAPLRGFIRGDQKFIDLPIKEVYDLKRDFAESKNLAELADLPRLEKDLRRLEKKLGGEKTVQKLDSAEQDTLNKLRSLGYISTGVPKKKKKYTAQDDLKTLLPLQNKLHDAVKDFRSNRPQAALAKLQEIVEERPDFISAFNRMGNLYYSLGDKDRAVEVLRAGLEANPKNLYLMSRLGLMLVEVQEFKEAVKLVSAANAQIKDLDSLLNVLAKVQLPIKQVGEIIKMVYKNINESAQEQNKARNVLEIFEDNDNNAFRSQRG